MATSLLEIAALHYKSSSQQIKTTFELRVPISFPGAKLKYSFGTENHDINFGMIFESAHGDQTVIMAQERIQSQKEPFTGTYEFNTSGGMVVLVWDNSYSWLRAKALSYSVTLQPPAKEQLMILHAGATRQQLLNCSEDIMRAGRRKKRAGAEAHELRNDIRRLNDQISALQLEASQKSRALADLDQEQAFLQRRIATHRQSSIPSLVLDLVQGSGWVEPLAT
mmetsp:Transcript_87979/g.175980  ORF Transcript_87979/g.175980 Transcript_87979/m.175980 type:complete len:223 (+) Transcript_87979:175-843(+)